MKTHRGNLRLKYQWFRCSCFRRLFCLYRQHEGCCALRFIKKIKQKRKSRKIQLYHSLQSCIIHESQSKPAFIKMVWDPYLSQYFVIYRPRPEVPILSFVLKRSSHSVRLIYLGNVTVLNSGSQFIATSRSSLLIKKKSELQQPSNLARAAKLVPFFKNSYFRVPYQRVNFKYSGLSLLRNFFIIYILAQLN